jgi:hypothetical protein
MIFLSSFNTIDFATVFGEDYQKAMTFCNTHKVEIEEKANQHGLPADELTAIVFPELIRYSTFKNFFETKALEYVYVQQGSAVVDFSIGYFQMKPSFAEALENALIKEEHLKKQFERLLIPISYTASQQREIRLKRLKELSWQLDYLCCFYVITKHKFEKTLASLNSQRQLEFLATAYNTGFHKSSTSIEKAMNRPSYPYGSKYPEDQQYIYAAVAWDYYQQALRL